jgi:hypothetical protein
MLDEPYNICIKNITYLNKSNSILVNHIINKTKSSYRQKDCFDLCHSQYIINTCKLSAPLKFTWEIDPHDKFDCARKEYSNFLKKNINEFCKKDCPLECNSIEYDVKVTSTKFPNFKYGKYLINNPKVKSKYPNGYNITLEDLRESLLSFSIYYTDFKYTYISQYPKMRFVDFLSNFGGLLGLFVGMSFLSFGELIQILIEVLFIVFEKKF